MSIRHKKSSKFLLKTPKTITLGDSTVDEHLCFLGTIITQDLEWELNIIFFIKSSTAEDALPEAADLGKNDKENDGELLHLHNRFYPHASILDWYAAATTRNLNRLHCIIALPRR